MTSFISRVTLHRSCMPPGQEANYVKESDLLNLAQDRLSVLARLMKPLLLLSTRNWPLLMWLLAPWARASELPVGWPTLGKHFDKSSWDNLWAVLDINRLGQSEPAPLQHNMEVYRKRCEAFGLSWQAKQVKDKPTCIVAKTFKGKGLKNFENLITGTGKPIPKDRVDDLLKDLQLRSRFPTRNSAPSCPKRTQCPPDLTPIGHVQTPSLQTGREDGDPAWERASKRVVAMDGDTKNSTFSDTFRKAFPDRYIECFIAEQNMVSVAIGCATRDRTVAFASTFAAFFSRGYDQIRMARHLPVQCKPCGLPLWSLHRDGPSQMALEDLAMFRAIPTCTVFYPSDAVSTERAVELAANTKVGDPSGSRLILLNRAYVSFAPADQSRAVIYTPDEKFEVGVAKVRGTLLHAFGIQKASGQCGHWSKWLDLTSLYAFVLKVVRQSDSDQVTVIGAGWKNIRVVDPFTIKPLDAATILSAARATGGRIITVEDHYKEGGLGEAVLSAVGAEPGVVVTRMAVSGVPRSGKPQELLDLFKISAKHIAQAVRQTFAN
ncbi:Transketolase [Merluccius polli]|uniref:transketolase n=1 Tax=Merluccius polli TaxID=89951 RepID=A0AA47P416_MERPO|nr:Transketolase [Merluccius polli]